MSKKIKVELTEGQWELVTKALSSMSSKCFGAKLRAERNNYKKSVLEHYDKEGRDATSVILEIRKQAGVF
jgi:hypothetical protein